MIQISSLDFSYAESGFRLTIPEVNIGKNEKIVIVGPSGTGKTTLMNLIAGILVPRTGSLTIDGVDITQFEIEDRQDFRAVKMGLIFQEFELLDYLSVLDNILLPYRVNAILQLDQTVVDQALRLGESVGLGKKLHRRPGNLSQGERQRAAVCRALLTQPAILLGDEPTGNLDPRNRDQVMDILFDYSQKVSAPLIIITHDQQLLSRFDRKIDVTEFVT
ncbi:MAG: ABC transporter ATP-binding protein [Desulfobacterales bacterium SG8_35_2]|nr:MAG: ABC transporter ATP-binding protein [Desulfobacterales bacterium SG8_35_2]